MSTRPNPISIGIVGGGAVAHALSAALGASSYTVKVWARRAAASASVAGLGAGRAQAVDELTDLMDCDALLIAVSDSALEAVAAQLRTRLGPAGPGGRAIFHTGGAATGADALRSLDASASALGSLHPLVAVASDRAPEADGFQGRPFMVEATSELAVKLGQDLVHTMGGFEVQLPASTDSSEASGHKARYHALATMVASGVVTLVDRAAESMAQAGPAGGAALRSDFRRAYGALAASAVQNVLRDGGARVLTGAIARGDEQLVARHRDVLDGDVAAPLYRAVEEAARGMLSDSPDAATGNSS